MPKPTSIMAKTPVLEWFAAAIGLGMLLLLLGAIGYDALHGGSHVAPNIQIKTQPAVKVGNLYLVMFKVVNQSGGTAAALEIEGRLIDRDRVVDISTATIDYVAGHGKTEGGLFFTHDPNGVSLIVTPLGFQKP